MPPVINKEKCNGCNICVEICPLDVIKKVSKDVMPDIKYPDECWHCNSCVLDCPQKAMSLRIPLTSELLYVNTKE